MNKLATILIIACSSLIANTAYATGEQLQKIYSTLKFDDFSPGLNQLSVAFCAAQQKEKDKLPCELLLLYKLHLDEQYEVVDSRLPEATERLNEAAKQQFEQAFDEKYNNVSVEETKKEIVKLYRQIYSPQANPHRAECAQLIYQFRQSKKKLTDEQQSKCTMKSDFTSQSNRYYELNMRLKYASMSPEQKKQHKAHLMSGSVQMPNSPSENHGFEANNVPLSSIGKASFIKNEHSAMSMGAPFIKNLDKAAASLRDAAKSYQQRDVDSATMPLYRAIFWYSDSYLVNMEEDNAFKFKSIQHAFSMEARMKRQHSDSKASISTQLIKIEPINPEEQLLFDGLSIFTALEDGDFSAGHQHLARFISRYQKSQHSANIVADSLFYIALFPLTSNPRQQKPLKSYSKNQQKKALESLQKALLILSKSDHKNEALENKIANMYAFFLRLWNKENNNLTTKVNEYYKQHQQVDFNNKEAFRLAMLAVFSKSFQSYPLDYVF